jgi:hypothetical protein
LLFRETGLSVDGGNVVDDVNPVGRLLDRIRVGQVARHHLDLWSICPEGCHRPTGV